jgi:hypothetical protein
MSSSTYNWSQYPQQGLDPLEDLPFLPPHPSVQTPVREIAKTIFDSRGQEIWTCRKFQWGTGKMFTREFAKDLTPFTTSNDLVTTMWSEDYFISTKKDIGLFKNAIKNVGLCFWHLKIADAFKHIANALIIAAGLVVNIELANFFKGLLGIVSSTLKLGFRPVLFVIYLLAAIAKACSGDKERAKELFFKALSNVGLIFKDLITLVTSLGHAIPSWLPIVLTFIFPPAGIALAIVKIASQFTGIFDVLAYGGTALLLYTKAKFAKWEIENYQQSKADGVFGKKRISDAAYQEALEAQQAWERLKTELHPLKSVEGATLATYGINILAQGAATAVDVFAPGAGTLAKYIAYGVTGAAGIGLIAANKKTRRDSAAKPPSMPSPTRTSPPSPTRTRSDSSASDISGISSATLGSGVYSDAYQGRRTNGRTHSSFPKQYVPPSTHRESLSRSQREVAESNPYTTAYAGNVAGMQ